ncbi:hypothetical protein Avbf_16197 [Armadillidium vulgare]|nr:hypothetical protein Avbf_16197 [Armadillidium vulgare]
MSSVRNMMPIKWMAPEAIEQRYSLLLQCWRSNPVERPRFNQIADILSDMLNPNKTKSYVNMNIVYKQMNEEWLSRNEDYLDMVTSPDFQNFQNLHSHRSDEGVILGPIDTLNTEQVHILSSESRETHRRWRLLGRKV